MSTIDWGGGNIENVPHVISFFYESIDRALNDLKEAYKKLEIFDVKPFKFSEHVDYLNGFSRGCLYLLEKRLKKARFPKKGNEWRVDKRPTQTVRISEYRDENKNGHLLTIRILSRPSRYSGGFDFLESNLAIAKTLANMRKSK